MPAFDAERQQHEKPVVVVNGDEQRLRAARGPDRPTPDLQQIGTLEHVIIGRAGLVGTRPSAGERSQFVANHDLK